jgi:hypothetical protein
MANEIFAKVLAMGPIDDEWGVEEQTDDQIIFKGAFGHAAVSADGKVTSKVAKYVEMLEAAIRGEELPVKATKSSIPAVRQGGHITSRSQAGSVPGPSTNAAQAIQIMQAGKDLTYTVSKKQAPNATMALMAATDAKIDLVEVNAILTDELASSTIRASRKNGRSVDATVSIRKTDFINLLAWKEVDAQEKLKNMILDDSDPLNIALPNGFPRIKPDAMVSIRVKDENSNKIEKRRAIVHIYIEAMQQWIFQQRQCQTKAKRNAIIQALTSSGNPMEVMDEDELADEAREVEMVENSKP